ncbi:MAG: phytanoyl-CoA dioxygenase family protein [Pseudomonadota bacterium]
MKTNTQTPPRVERYEDLAGDLAGSHPLGQGLATPVADPDHHTAFEHDGFVIVRQAIDSGLTRRAFDGLSNQLGPTGRNAFEGERTQRAYALLAKTRALDPLVEHEAILGLICAHLGDEPLLSACLGINILPEETAQPAHFDDGFYPVARPRPTMGVSVIWALSRFTEANGATQVWPGSHLWGDERRPQDDDAMLHAEMEAGDAIVFHGSLWHAGGANTTKDEARLGLTAQYCAPWLRTQENMSLAVPPSVVDGLSPRLKSLLGYQIQPPFMGHVNGMHPKRLLVGAR